jgi:hypothetical protein
MLSSIQPPLLPTLPAMKIVNGLWNLWISRYLYLPTPILLGTGYPAF